MMNRFLNCSVIFVVVVVVVDISSQTYTQPMSNGDWKYDLCDCCSDCGDCCYAFFCLPCYEMRVFSHAGEGCCSCLFGGLVPLRTKIRAKKNIQVSYMNQKQEANSFKLCCKIDLSNNNNRAQFATIAGC